MCRASSVFVPGVSTTETSRSHGVGTSTVTTSAAADGEVEAAEVTEDAATADVMAAASVWRNKVIDSVVGSTPTRQWASPSKAFSNDDLPALNSPTVHSKNTDVAAVSRSTEV